MERIELEARLKQAISAFIEGERFLLQADAHEQALTAKFAAYLAAQFPEWDVDCEYDKLGANAKRLRWRRPFSARGTLVRPDIVVHQRGKKENLLVIEAKKVASSMLSDRRKLRAFKVDDRYEYEHAAALLFTTGHGAGVTFELC